MIQKVDSKTFHKLPIKVHHTKAAFSITHSNILKQNNRQTKPFALFSSNPILITAWRIFLTEITVAASALSEHTVCPTSVTVFLPLMLSTLQNQFKAEQEYVF